MPQRPSPGCRLAAQAAIVDAGRACREDILGPYHWQAAGGTGVAGRQGLTSHWQMPHGPWAMGHGAWAMGHGPPRVTRAGGPPPCSEGVSRAEQ
jgi:hypothetical protein